MLSIQKKEKKMSDKTDNDNINIQIEKSTIFDEIPENVKKQKKTKRGFAPVIALVSLAVIILLVIGSVYVLNETVEAPTTTHNPTLPPEIKHEVVSKFASSVKSIVVTNENGGFEIINNDGLYKLTGTDKIPISNDAILKFISLCDSFYASSIIDENADDISIYGLDRPFSDIKITLDNSKKINIKFGNADPSKSGRYCTADGKKVFLVDNEQSDSFLQKKEIFADKQVIPPVSETSKNFDYFANGKLFRFDQITLGGTLRQKPISFFYDINDELRPMKITSPSYTNADGEALKSLIALASEGLIVYQALVFNPTTEDLKQYGLINPPTTVTYKVGDISHKISYAAIPQSADIAIYTEGVPAIYLSIYDQVEFYNKLLDAFRAGNLFLTPIRDVSVLSVETDEGKFDFNISHIIKTENGEEKESIVVTKNSQKINEDNFKRFFAQTLIFNPDNFVETTEAPKGKPYIKITYKYTDTARKDDVAAFYKHDGISYRYTLNSIGDQLFLNNRIENIASNLKLLLQGKTITY